MLISMLAKPARALPWQEYLTGRLPPARLAWSGVGLMLSLLPATLVLLELDPRLLNGISVWAKPVKFQLSLALHLATLGLLLRLLTPAAQQSWTLRLGFLLALAAAFFEILYITLQAARGRASHFNIETPLEAMLYQAMGVGAVVIVLVAAQLGVAVYRHAAPETGAGLRLGAVLGLVLGAAATLVTAGALGSGEIAGFGHLVGGYPDDSRGLPLLGWSQSGGDLRVPHFFATHLMQGLPLLGLVADRAGPGRARQLVWAGAVLGAAVIVATFLQAVAGRPFLTLS
jgi:hypothetical protein